MSKPRIGIIGAGSMARERAHHFLAQSAAISGIWARSVDKARALSETLATTVFSDCDRLIDASDAVMVCVPNALHARFAAMALARGKHVLVEYPLCCDEEELRRLMECRSAQQVLMVGNTILHEAPYVYLQKHKDRLGTLLGAGSRVSWHSAGIEGSWFFDPKLRGPLFAALHYHHIEYFRRLMGDAGQVWACADADPRSVGGTLMMSHAAGATSVVQWHLVARGDGLARGMWLTGADAAISIVSQRPGMSHAIWNGGESIDEIPDDWGVAGSCRDFLDAINGALDHAERLKEDIATLRTAWRAESNRA